MKVIAQTAALQEAFGISRLDRCCSHAQAGASVRETYRQE